jgi:Ca2+-binding RTX toxin-like protein
MPSVPTFQGQEFLVNDPTTTHEYHDVDEIHQIDPTQTVLGNGDILVAWETAERTDEHPANEIDARILNPDGTIKTPEFALNTDLSIDGSLAIKTLPSGDGLVAFGSSGWVIDADGHVGPEVTPPANAFPPDTIALSNGNELMTSVVLADSGPELHGQIVDPDSGAAGPDFLIGNSGYEVIGNSESVTALADGRAFVAWEGDGGIEARVINADGSMDPAFFVNTATNAAEAFPHVTELPNGEIFVTWASWAANPDGSGSDDGYDIHGRLLTLDHTISGTPGNDVLVGSAGADDIYGAGGNDSLTGGAGNDVLSGGTGHNVLWGNAGDDTFLGGSGIDSFAGGSGNDTVTYESSDAGVAINLATGAVSGGDATGDSLNSIENVIGSTHDDSLTGDAGANRLDGSSGDDLIWGGDGNDILIGGHGADVLSGGNGIDTADYSASLSAVTVNLSLGTGSGGDAQGDKLSSIENVTGSAFNDQLTGNAIANQLTGGAGNDTLSGAAGNDHLDGGAGNDFLVGGSGKDTLTGGDGADTFAFKSVQDSAPGHEDQIIDFSSAQGDHIDLSGIDANTNVAGDEAFGYIGSAAFSDVAGQLRYADHFLEGDVNGDGTADFRIHVNVASLQHGDFVL